MRMLKLPWLVHQEEGKKFEIYSVSVSPDGSRIASGGLDGKVRVWLVNTIRDYEKQIEELERKSLTETVPDAATEATEKTTHSMETCSSASNPTASKPTQQEAPLDPSFDIEIDSRVCRPLCSMGRHTGAVTCVQFSPNGRFLASGSDDKILLIWEKDEETSRNMAINMEQRLAFASGGFGGAGGDIGAVETADLEHWVVRKRLVAHDNDIQDLAWSPDSSLLVSVGLDRSIIVWSGTTFEKIKRFDIHQSHVKGVVFDPANKYFVTSSDDRTLRVFRYHRSSPTDITFTVESIIRDPFKKSPLNTYFRRCSWSPDGQHIAAPNAMNGHFSSVAIVHRGTWDSDISLLGHNLPCEVTSFSPRLFEIENNSNSSNSSDKKAKKDNQEVATVLATAGQDRTLVIWNTSTATPLVVAFDICINTITDMAWSPTGDILYISSLDGSITTMFFKDDELGKPIPLEQNDAQLHIYGADRESTAFPESVEQLMLEEKAEKEFFDVTTKLDKLMERGKDDANLGASTTNTTAAAAAATATSIISSSSLAPTANAPTASNLSQSTPTTAPKINILTPSSQKVTITKSGKKRVAPVLVTSNVVSSKTSADNGGVIKSKSVSSSIDTKKKQEALKKILSRPSVKLPKFGLQTVVSSIRDSLMIEKDEPEEKDLETQIDAIHEQTNQTKKQSNTRTYNFTKRKKEVDVPEFISDSVVAPTTVFSDMKIQPDVLIEITGSDHLEIRNDNDNDDNTGKSGNKGGSEFDDSHISSVKVFDSTSLENPQRFQFYANEKFENAVHSSYDINSEVSIDYWCFTTENGAVHVLSKEGRLLMPIMDLGVSISHACAFKEFIMLVTRNGLVYTYNVKAKKRVLSQVSLSPLLTEVKEIKEKEKYQISTKISTCNLTKSGLPLVMLNNYAVFIYDINMSCWLSVLDPWKINQLDFKVIQEQKRTLCHGENKPKILRSMFNKILFNLKANQNTDNEVKETVTKSFIESNDYISKLLG